METIIFVGVVAFIVGGFCGLVLGITIGVTEDDTEGRQ